MLAAHMDEIGLVVRFVEKSGFLRFAPMGTWSTQVLPAQRVVVHTRSNGSIPGAVGTKPPHLMTEEDKKKVVDLSQMFIDIGANSDEAVTIDRELKVMSDGKTVTGKALDDRVGCAIMIDVFKEINQETGFTVYAVATAQEEMNLHSPVELVSLEDAKNASKLIKACLRRIQPVLF